MKDFVIGHEYIRKKIHKEWGGGYQGGISPSRRHPVIFLFTGKSGEQYGYNDTRDSDGVFWYAGEGRVGDMQLTRGNLAITKAREEGRRLRLFEQTSRGQVIFRGDFEYLKRRERRGPDQRGEERRVIEFGLTEVADPSYWLEITDRPDIGGELWAPQTHEGSDQAHAYACMREVRRGDIILHYDTTPAIRSIVAYSRAVEKAHAADVKWKSHVTATRNASRTPRRRRGWSLAITGTVVLSSPLSLRAIRRHEGAVKRILDTFAKSSRDARHMPFVFRSDDMRTQEQYLTRFPPALLRLFPELRQITRSVARPPGLPPVRSRTFGRRYVPVDVHEPIVERKVPKVDLEKLDRGLKSHKVTQELLRRYVRYELRHHPKSPLPEEPQYDLGWKHRGVHYIAEVKSLTYENEDRQLRIGLGQVLGYWFKVSRTGRKTRAVLMLERAPSDPLFVAFCALVGVVVVWPGYLDALKAKQWPARDLDI
jgi:hypothetical protein